MNSKGIDCLGDNGFCIPISTYSVKTVKKQTNAEKIRSMSDEELAEFICTHEVCKWDCSSDDIPDIIDWLQSEAE